MAKPGNSWPWLATDGIRFLATVTPHSQCSLAICEVAPTGFELAAQNAHTDDGRLAGLPVRQIGSSERRSTLNIFVVLSSTRSRPFSPRGAGPSAFRGRPDLDARSGPPEFVRLDARHGHGIRLAGSGHPVVDFDHSLTLLRPQTAASRSVRQAWYLQGIDRNRERGKTGDSPRTAHQHPEPDRPKKNARIPSTSHQTEAALDSAGRRPLTHDRLHATGTAEPGTVRALGQFIPNSSSQGTDSQGGAASLQDNRLRQGGPDEV